MASYRLWKYKKSILVGTKYKEWFGTSQDVFDDNIFIGIDIDLHIVVGGHFKLGFDLDMLGNDEPSYNGGFRKWLSIVEKK